MSKEFKPLVYYYARRKWYDQLSKCCDQMLAKKKDPMAVFWKAFGLGMCGYINDSLRLLESFQSRRDMQYPVTLARLYFHQRAAQVDYESISSLEHELGVAEEITKEAGFIMAARFSLFTGDYENANRVAGKLLSNKSSDSSTVFELEAVTIQQWCTVHELEAAGHDLPSDYKKRLQGIDVAYRGKNNSESVEVDSLMVWARSRHFLGLNADVLNILNQVIAMFPGFLPALADKALLLASAGEWDQSLDTAQRLLDVDREYLDALQVIAVHAFTQESHSHDAVQKLEDLDAAMRAREPASLEYAVDLVTLFSAICARQPRALHLCVGMLDRVLKSGLTAEEEARVYAEMGCVQTMQGPMFFEKAMKSFHEAIKRSESNVRALEGMILCQLCEGLVDDAEGQLEVVMMFKESDAELGYEFLYLQSLLLRHKKDAKKEHLSALNACMDLFAPTSKKLEAMPSAAHVKPYMNAFASLRAANPDFAMLLASDYLSHSDPAASIYVSSGGTDTSNSLQGHLAASAEESKDARSESVSNVEISPAVQCGLDLLNRVIRLCPGNICAYVEVARCYSSLGLFDEAYRSLHQCLAMQPNCAPILLAIAKVEISRAKLTSADRVLEQALACDFSIRSIPLFKLIKALVRSQQSRLDEALNEIESLLALPEFGYSLSNANNVVSSSVSSTMFTGGTNYADSLRLTEDDRVGAFVVYASLLGKLRRLKEANKVLGHAKVTFAGSPQEVQVLVAASQMYVEKGDFDSAIRMLDKISEDSPTYARAQTIKADIILTNNHDKEGYTRCYQQMAEKDPSARNFSLLGEAYLRILNPESAIDALERAYKLDPTNSRLRGRIGRTLVSTHEYHRAVEFYESAIRELQKTNKTGSVSSDVISLSHDLAKLYIKLGRAQNSIRVLNGILHDSPSDLTEMRQDVTTLLILTKVQNSNSPSDSLGTYMRAYDLQKDVVVKVRSTVSALSSHEIIDAEKSTLSNICDKIGCILVESGDVAPGESKLNEAVQYNLQNTKAMTGLAKLYHSRGDREQCVAQCNKIITAVPTAEEAAILLSDIQLQGEESSDHAVDPLLNLLKLQPNNYNTLEKAITLLRRAGKLEEVAAYLKAAETADRRCTSHAGYHFCLGLYARYTNDIGKSISEFNLARKDETWGAAALVHMIELFLNPDQEGVWEEKETGPVDEATRAKIHAAEQLLSELRPVAKDEKRVKVLENYCSLATRLKLNVDKAMTSFSELLDRDPEYLPAVLGMATGFMIDKNQHKARNLLKRVGKMELSQHDGEDFEKANLLLAKFYIDKGKNDLAQELCRKTLLQNKSCSQAWEILGLVFEKEGNYESAADAYEKAWKLEFEASASVGFKLAFSYLKCRKLVESIDVCEKVLAQYPDYPRINEEILKKAQQSFRSTAAV